MKTKFKVGDKVKVREDLIIGEIYSSESGYSDCYMKRMNEFKGVVVTIRECSNTGAYKIEEDVDNYNWTDEMFEESSVVIPEVGKYYTSTKNGKVWQVYKVSNIGANFISTDDYINTNVGAYFLRNSTEFNIEGSVLRESTNEEISWLLHCKSLDRYVKFEDFKALQPKTPEELLLEEANRRYPLGTKFYPAHLIDEYSKEAGTFCIVKEKLELFGSDVIKTNRCETAPYYEGVVFCGGKWATIIPPFEEWVIGTYVVQIGERLNSRWLQTTSYGKVYKIVEGTSDLPYIEDDNGYTINFITENESNNLKWFVTKEEAEKFAETLKPKVTVESEMKRYGLSIGDHVKIVDEPVIDGFYCNFDGTGRFDKLAGIRGNTIIIEEAFIAPNDKLYLQHSDWYGPQIQGVWAECVSKVPTSFKLGGYEVKVTSETVKVGCTSIGKEDAVNLLQSFIAISDKFNTCDLININSVKITTSDAKELLEFIRNSI